MITSRTKQSIASDTVQSLLAECGLGPATAIQELHDGYFNAAFTLTGAGGQRTVLKVAPSPTVRVLRGEVDLMQTEVDTMRFVAAHTSLPVPAIRAARFASGVIDGSYFVMDHLDGVPLDKLLRSLAPDLKRDLYVRLGRYARELHAFHPGRFGIRGQEHDTWSEAFLAIVRDVLADRADVGADLGVEPARLWETMASFAGVLDSVREPSLLHKDLWFGNIFVDPETLAITGIIDWERSLAGDPLMENVCALVDGLFPFDARDAFYAGYGRDPVLDEGEQIRVDLYSIYLALLLIVEGYFRDYRNAQQEAHMQSAIRGLLAGLEARRA